MSDAIEALAEKMYADDHPTVSLPLPSASNLAEAWLRDRYIDRAREAFDGSRN